MPYPRDALALWRGEALADLAEAFGDRPAAVARELTKRFEEVRRGGLAELAAHYAAHDMPAIVVVGPPVEQLRGTGHAANARAPRVGFGRDDQRPAVASGDQTIERSRRFASRLR